MIGALPTNLIPLDLNEARSRKRNPATGSRTPRDAAGSHCALPELLDRHPGACCHEYARPRAVYLEFRRMLRLTDWLSGPRFKIGEDSDRDDSTNTSDFRAQLDLREIGETKERTPSVFRAQHSGSRISVSSGGRDNPLRKTHNRGTI
jgi:hypothetical protein